MFVIIITIFSYWSLFKLDHYQDTCAFILDLCIQEILWKYYCWTTIFYYSNPNYDIEEELRFFDVNITQKLAEVPQEFTGNDEMPAPPKLPKRDPRDQHLPENQSPEVQFWIQHLLGKKTYQTFYFRHLSYLTYIFQKQENI